MDERLMQARSYLESARRPGPAPARLTHYDAVLTKILRYLEAQDSARATTGPVTSPSGWVVAEPTEGAIQALSLQPGEQMVADLFHAAHCSECAEALGAFLAKCRTHALDVGGIKSTSQRPDSWPPAGRLA